MATDLCLAGALNGQGKAAGAHVLGGDGEDRLLASDAVHQTGAVGSDLAASQRVYVELVGGTWGERRYL